MRGNTTNILCMALLFSAISCASSSQSGLKPGTGSEASALQPAAISSEAANTTEKPELVTREQLRKANTVLDEGIVSNNLEIQTEALAALGASKRIDALVRLTKMLEAENGEARHGAARGMFYLGDRSAADALVKAFRAEKGWSVKKELARAAAVCQVRALIPDLKKALTDRNTELKIAAAFALQDLGDPSGAPVLAKLGNPERKGVAKEGSDRWSRKVLEGEKDGDKALAAKTLAQLGTSDDARLLGKYLDDQNASLRLWSAAAILARINAAQQ